MKNNNSITPKSGEKKGINIGVLIVCFFIACGIWLYAQAIDDEINKKTFNHLQIEIEGDAEFKEQTGYDIHSLGVQNAIVSISGTNRELAKYDAEDIRLIADASTAKNSRAAIRAYVINDKGEKVELKNYEVTPAVVTINVAQQVKYNVDYNTENLDKENYNYTIDPNTTNGTFTVIGPVEEVAKIATAKFTLNLDNVKFEVGSNKISPASVSFHDKDGVLLFSDTNKSEDIKYDANAIIVSVTVEVKNPEQDE